MDSAQKNYKKKNLIESTATVNSTTSKITNNTTNVSIFVIDISIGSLLLEIRNVISNGYRDMNRSSRLSTAEMELILSQV